MYDYHIHSNFSFDSVTTMDEFCQKAVQQNLNGICFTDHIDFVNVNKEDNVVDLAAFHLELEKMRQKWGKNFSIAGGLEIGLQPEADEPTRQYLKEAEVDFIIGSIHVADKKELYTGDFCYGLTKEAAYIKYLEFLLEEVKRQDYIHVLGHMDCVRRDNRYQDRSFPLSLYGELTEAILKTLIEKGQGIELNTGSYRYGLDCPHPDIDVLKLYKKLGGEILTLGSDAHSVKNLAYHFPVVKEIVKAGGFDYISYFISGKEYRMPL